MLFTPSPRTHSRIARAIIPLCGVAAVACSAQRRDASEAAQPGTAGSAALAGAAPAPGSDKPFGAGHAAGDDTGTGSAGREPAGMAGAESSPPLPATSACRAALPRIQPLEPARAAHGEALLRNMTL